MAGIRMPIESHPLQAFVSESLKPVLDTVVMSNAVHGPIYISQSDKGELVIGAGIDHYLSYAQRGSLARHRRRRRRPSSSCSRRSRRVRLNCVSGAASWISTLDGPPDHQQDQGQGPLFQLRMGYRWLQGDTGVRLGVRPHHRPRQSASAQSRHSRSIAFRPGTCIDEHGAAGVAH